MGLILDSSVPISAEHHACGSFDVYAAKDCERTPKSSSDRLASYKLFDQQYREFLSSSTLLASLVPPNLREEVLRVEEVWDEIGQGGFETVSGKKRFDLLDSVRYQIIDSIVYSRLTDPFWKFQIKN
jgi:hypothetical protein